MELSHQILEIEHKFIVADDFDTESFFASVRDLQCENEFATEVLDTYYFNRANPDFVLRHRKDDRIEQLSYKSVAADNEVRTEINLNLAMGKNSQDIVAEFCLNLGMIESAQLRKSVRVFEFKDMEIVHYIAQLGESKLCCIEFESIRQNSPDLAKQTIRRYESRLGFDAQVRETRSLFDLLVLPFVSQNKTRSPNANKPKVR